MSNLTVYFNAKRRFWQERRNGQQLVLTCCTMSRSTLQATNSRTFANSRGGHVPRCLATRLHSQLHQLICSLSVCARTDICRRTLMKYLFLAPISVAWMDGISG